ncbi:hypothetical protein OPV22_015540 [Ensete ventricosum]|uniref:Uncharacterized protein n=1 Tax=Ensete ventricosum TaxID=4639 RepID=A0AAV8PT29_ENSVE|nr:hypothetical protein OPV22_015540 [Ensete ventricosum]
MFHLRLSRLGILISLAETYLMLGVGDIPKSLPCEEHKFEILFFRDKRQRQASSEILDSFSSSEQFSFYPLPNYSLFDSWCHHHLVKSFISNVNPTIAASKKYEDDIFIPLR